MKISYISTFPPRECGIATFTQNLVRAIGLNLPDDDPQQHAVVVAINDCGNQYAYPPEVGFTIFQDQQKDYISAARFINHTGADACILEHEFGIFGGESGVYILQLLRRLEIPLIATFHTVLREPSYLQKMILQQIAQMAAKVVVMSRRAVGFLENVYNIPLNKIKLIEHGVPDEPVDIRALEREWPECRGRRVLFTFGLLSRNKGIETVIRALPGIVARHPEVLYIVLGNTHPAVARSSGEEYRNYLKGLATALGVEGHVRFIDRFVTEKQLADYLSAIDIYITPYLNEAQITSGTLSYAIGAGAAVISTPYWHAQELLDEGRGRLFPFRDHVRLRNIVTDLLEHPATLAAVREKALAYGRHLKWPKTGARYLRAIDQVKRTSDKPDREAAALPPGKPLPSFSMAHVRRLTDNTGIVQHAKYGIPNLKEGYCLDDNARALIMTLMAFRQYKSPEALQLLPVYLTFIQYVLREDGNFRNFLSFTHEYLDKVGSEDSFGRTIWAMGYLVRYAPDAGSREFGCEIFRRAAQHFRSLKHLRGIGNSVIGICHYLKYHAADEGMLQALNLLTQKLVNTYEQHYRPAVWHWFEERMTYDNGILPLALLHAFEITGDTHTKQVALESLQFLETVTLKRGYFTPVGNKGWYNSSASVIPLYDQQAIETMAMVLLYRQAYLITGKADYLRKMAVCHRWFLGENELGVPLYDPETHGCCDGLQEAGVNRNQGAESTLAYLISHLTVTKALGTDYGYPMKHEAPEVLL